jgi:alpha-methylacyl-CoA racemase
MRVITGTDACALPVLTPAEAHASESFDRSFPMAHPRVSGSQPTNKHSKVSGEVILSTGKHTYDVLEEIRLSDFEKHRLTLDGALGEEARLRISASARSHKL